MSSHGVVGMLGKCHRAFGGDTGDGESAALGCLSTERSEPPIGFYARGHAANRQETNACRAE